MTSNLPRYTMATPVCSICRLNHLTVLPTDSAILRFCDLLHQNDSTRTGSHSIRSCGSGVCAAGLEARKKIEKGKTGDVGAFLTSRVQVASIHRGRSIDYPAPRNRGKCVGGRKFKVSCSTLPSLSKDARVAWARDFAVDFPTKHSTCSARQEPRRKGVILEMEIQLGAQDVKLLAEFSEHEILLAHYVPVYVMLPLDTVTMQGLSEPERLKSDLRALKDAGVDGVMCDVWWGLVEATEPKVYNWLAYELLFREIQSAGLKIQVVMSFHQCGGNTGDSCYIPLPHWILEVGKQCPDIFFTNQRGGRNKEYLSFGVDEEPILEGRTAVQVYYDFMKSFRQHMGEFFDAGLIAEIEVGLGPAGEMRYPSYPETQGWKFPGIGEFQCYDMFLLAELRGAAKSVGQFEWGQWGPHNAGHYNDVPSSTGFFGADASYLSEYGRFFLDWYSSVLLRHGDRVLEVASDVFYGCRTKLAAKVAGIHWWYMSKNHAAELAAGYYNMRDRDGYEPIARMLARHNATLNFTCVEMRNEEHTGEARCGPEGLVQQVLNACWRVGVEVACENALPRYDADAFDQIVANARPDGIDYEGLPARKISAFTFLRLGPELMDDCNWWRFASFVRAMHAGLDYHPDPDQLFRPRTIVRHSKPIQAMAHDDQKILSAFAPASSAASPLVEDTSASTEDKFFSPDAPGGGLGVRETFFSQNAPSGGLGEALEMGGSEETSASEAGVRKDGPDSAKQREDEEGPGGSGGGGGGGGGGGDGGVDGGSWEGGSRQQEEGGEEEGLELRAEAAAVSGQGPGECWAEENSRGRRGAEDYSELLVDDVGKPEGRWLENEEPGWVLPPMGGWFILFDRFFVLPSC